MAGDTVYFEEATEYLLLFENVPPTGDARALLNLGGEWLSSTTALIAFGNFVGSAEFMGVTITVTSSKLGSDGFAKMLEEVSESSGRLIFAPSGRTRFSAGKSREWTPPVPYHQLQVLRANMMRDRIGHRFQDWLDVIAQSPTRLLKSARALVPTPGVRELDPFALRLLFAKPKYLGVLEPTSALWNSPLAHALEERTTGVRYFPSRVSALRHQTSYDTVENRFVKHVVKECLSLAQRFSRHPRLTSAAKADCIAIIRELEFRLRDSMWDEVSELTTFAAPTQALSKKDGYRDVLSFWLELSQCFAWPPPQQTKWFLEARNAATLYEYWVFIRIVRSVRAATGINEIGSVAVTRDEFGESLTINYSTQAAVPLTVLYNPTYSRTRGNAYSTPLRPDVVVRYSGRSLAFDAKYRFTPLGAIDQAEEDEGSLNLQDLTFRRADLYKMHTYRDAISQLKAAFVVYPGTEFVFFDRVRGLQTDAASLDAASDGVGSIPLRPSAPVDESLVQSIAALMGPPSAGN